MVKTFLKEIPGILVFLLAAPLISAQPLSVDTTAIDSFVTDRMLSTSVPGVSLAIVNDSGTFYQKAYGYAGADQRALSTRIPMCIGSLTKSFTALAIMQLIDHERIQLRESVAKYISSFQSNTDDSNRITLFHLLTHTSGFSTLQGNQVIQTSKRNLAKPESLEKLVEKISEMEPAGKPGEATDYSNANYLVLAQIVQKISGMSYARYIRENIFRPLGMNQSFIRGENDIRLKPSSPYRFWFGYPVEYKAQIDDGPIGPTGIYASAGDMGRYLLAMMDQDSQLLSPETFELLFNTVRKYQSGASEMGWRYAKPNGIDTFWHSGQCPGASNNMAIYPDENAAIVVMANARSGGFHFSGVGALVGGPLQMMVGNEPVQSGPGGRDIILLLLLIMTITGLLGWGIRFIQAYKQNTLTSLTYQFDTWQIFRRIGIPIVLLSLLCYGLLVGLPNFNGTTLWGVFWFAPDLAWLLAISGSLAAGMAIIRTALLIKYTLTVNEDT